MKDRLIYLAEGHYARASNILHVEVGDNAFVVHLKEGGDGHTRLRFENPASRAIVDRIVNEVNAD